MLVIESSGVKTKPAIPPPPPIPRFWVGKTITVSVTNQEIAKFWSRKKDHLLAAIKAAARIRARNLTEEDCLCFEESLKDADGETHVNNPTAPINSRADDKQSEVLVGIKDWLGGQKANMLSLTNQPLRPVMLPEQEEYPLLNTPNCFHYKATALCPASLGVY